jgi:hypothetical protein
MAATQSPSLLSVSDQTLVVGHLNCVLAHDLFAGSKRRQAFLRYVVEETLAGRGGAIKETTVAVDVFGRSADFDAQSASVVRVTGGEVRKRLAQYYASEGDSPIRLELPVGSYQPVIHLPHDFARLEDSRSAVALPVEPQTTTAQVRTLSRARWWLAAGVAMLAVVAGFAWSMGREPALDRFWAPFVHHEQPVLVSLVSPTLLAIHDPQKWLPLRPGESIPTTALQEMPDSYVGTGAALGGALFAEQLALRKQPFVLKFGGDLSFADFKNAPTIVVGVSRWAGEINRKLRFRFVRGETELAIIDSRTGKEWSIVAGNRADRNEGYSLVTRLVNSEFGQPLILVEGMDSRNTQAAVEFLSRPADLGRFFDTAPAGWETHNLQVVLHNSIHGNSPGTVTVVASQVW